MSSIGFQDRARIAGAIRACRVVVAEEVTDEFLTRHPEWQAQHGDRARQLGMEDACYHQDFLAAAIESGEAESFRQYGDWAGRILTARHIEPRFLVENLEQIGQSLRVRLPAADAATVDSFIRSGVDRCLPDGTAVGSNPGGALELLTAMYTDAAIRGNRQAALNLLLDAARLGHPVIDLYSEVLQGAMYRIGGLWEENKITVAQEHMATAITQFVLAHLYALIEPTETSRGKAVVTGVQGEFHQVGAHMVADMLEADGWDVQFLGTDTPIAGVLEAIEEHKADILGISATMLFPISSVARLIDAARAKRGSRIRIMVGGRRIPLSATALPGTRRRWLWPRSAIGRCTRQPSHHSR